ncbi:MAG: DUF4837 family protein [Bacteroidales bacterium]|jgi:hypothetical protein|nr:DUF4837 family protein [Bacteroidales bacterium]
MKKYMKFMAIALAAMIALASCSEEKKRKALLPNISGKAGEVIVVIDKGNWEGAVGNVLRDSLAQETPYLPQREPLFGLVNVPKNAFTNMFQIHRNIIVVNISNTVTEPGIVIRKDVWATPQTVIYVNAADSEAAIEIIKENSALMAVTIEQAERDRIIRNVKKYEELKLAPVVAKMAGGSPHFPSGYKLKKATNDFIWIEYAIQDVTQGILIFKYPVVEGEQMMSLESIIGHSNEILKNNVPGMFDNTYMTTSSAVRPGIEYKRYKGLDFAEVRGFWEVYNDYMGGPFVSHAFYSQDGKDVIVMEGFVYAPKYDKRQYLRQVESIIYSFEWTSSEKD